MKALFTFLTVLSSVFITHPLFASTNTCIQNIEQHVCSHGDELNLNNCDLNDKDIIDVADYLATHSLVKEIYLENNAITDVGAKKIATFSGIRSLRMDYNQVTDIGAIVFANDSSYKTFSLEGNLITDKGAIALAHRNPTFLNLARNKISYLGAEAISKANNITQLLLSDNPIGDKGLIALAHSHAGLLELYGDIGCTHEGIKTFAKNIDHISTLGFGGHPLSHQDIQALANSSLNGLAAQNASLNDEDAEILSKSNFKYLYLDHNPISDKGAIAISENTHFYRDITISKKYLTDIGINALSGGFFNTFFVDDDTTNYKTKKLSKSILKDTLR